jgi:hypothetical protein
MKDFGNKEQQEEITEMFNTTTPPRLQIRTESIDETLRTIESDIKD